MFLTTKRKLLAALFLLVSVPFANAETAVDILKATGVQGGLVVHVGCGNGKLFVAHQDGSLVCFGSQ
jgi:hypothetical protein